MCNPVAQLARFGLESPEAIELTDLPDPVPPVLRPVLFSVSIRTCTCYASVHVLSFGPEIECTEDERLDFENIVFGMCVLGCDALYERGLISVLENGEICISDADGSRTLKGILRGFRGKWCVAWKESTAHYFDWHATRRFQG